MIRLILIIIILIQAYPTLSVEKGVKKIGKCWNYMARKMELKGKSCPHKDPKDNFQCSRIKGHRGKHHAHGLKDHCIVRWKQNKK